MLRCAACAVAVPVLAVILFTDGRAELTDEQRTRLAPASPVTPARIRNRWSAPRRPAWRAGALLAGALALVACVPVHQPGSGSASGGGASDGAAAGVGPCITDEPRLLHYARWLATDPDPQLDALRRRFEVERVAASDVEQVTNPVVCQRARSTYRAALDLADPPDAVAVIRVGDRYIVTSRVGGSTSREFASAVVLDESFRVLSSFRD